MAQIPSEEPVLPSEAYALLAQANLLRMRGHWEAAVEKCMAAMRLAPDNVSVTSLLGDIYENQGCIDDAIQWYRMALDRRPDSPADQLKLARLLDLKTHSRAGLLLPAPASTHTLPTRLAPPLQVRDSNRMLRVVTYLSALIVCAVILAALGFAKHPPSLAATAASERQLVTPPVVVTPETDTTDGNAALSARDPGEQTFVSSLQQSPDLQGQGISIVDVQDDPRTAHATLTFVYQPPLGSPVTRGSILQAVITVLHTAQQVPGTSVISAFTVRCLLSSPGMTDFKNTPLIFTGDIPRSSIPTTAPPAALTPADQALVPLTNVWWSESAPS